MINNWAPKEPPATPSPPARSAGRAWWRAWAILAVALLLGAYFRTINLSGWDGTSYLHPDERFIIFTVNNLQVPRSFADYLRSACPVSDGVLVNARNGGEPLDRQEPTRDSGCNTLNPRNYNWSRFFVYGTLPTTLTRVVVEARATLDAEQIRNTGRLLSTLWDLGSIIMVFLIGRRLYGGRVGALAALLLSMAVLPIQLSHFFTVDTASAFFTLLTVYCAVRVAQGGGPGSFVALGLSIGAAMACRVTLATLGLVAVLAVIQRIWLNHRPPTADHRPPTTDHQSPTLEPRARTRAAGIVSAFGLLVLAGLLSVLTFRVLQPDAFQGTSFFDVRPDPRFVENIRTVGAQVNGEQDFPPSQQWANRVRYLFPLQNMIIWGMGVPLGLAAWVGWAVATWQLGRGAWAAVSGGGREALRRHRSHLLPWAWITFYFAWQGGILGMTMRYYILLYGLLIIFAAWGLVALWDRRPRLEDGGWRMEDGGWTPGTILSSILHPLSSIFGGRWSVVGGRVILVAVAIGTLCWAYAFTRIYTRPHSRITASRWIYNNIPPGAARTFEAWDDPLPLHIDGRTDRQYIGVEMGPYAEDDRTKYYGNLRQDGSYDPGLFDQLDITDYIILSSNRVYDSATRQPMRYPALTRYYHYLFSGELGFELAADINSYPTLFGIPIPDQGAEEAFSVYDHPRVLIFKKTPSYSRARAEQLIGGDVAWSEVYKLPTVRIGQVPTALRLTEAQWPGYREQGTWAELFNPAGLANQAPWLVWLLVLELLGLATFPLLFRLLPGLPDRGFALAKTLGLLLVSYGAWLLASLGGRDGAPLMSFRPASLWLCAGLLIAAGGLAGWHGRVALLAFVRRRRTALLVAEGVFLLAFFGFLVLRAVNPDLWHPARGGEKPMDLAFLNAVLKSAAFPPYDPWFAGGYINYYYFGFVFIGALVHLTGVVPTTAYNLAIPTLFALTALGAWGATYNLIAYRDPVRRALRGRPAEPGTGADTPRQDLGLRPAQGEGRGATDDRGRPITDQWWRELPAEHLAEQQAPAAEPEGRLRGERRALATGVVAAVFVVLLGTLAQAAWFLPGTANTTDEGISVECRQAGSYAAQQACKGRPEWAFWDATRLVGMSITERTGEYDSTISEFPFFTFLYGDLHAHMIALPLAVAALGLMVALVKNENREPRTENREPRTRASWSRLGSWFLVLGSLALVVGALRATNTWDYPTYLGLSILTLGLVAWERRQRGESWPAVLGRWALSALGLLLLSVLLFLPFTGHFATDYAGFELWRGSRTFASDFLKINGLWLFLLLGAVLMLYQRARRISLLGITVVCGVALLLTLAALWSGTSALALLVPLVGGATWVLIDLLLGSREPVAPPPVAPAYTQLRLPLPDDLAHPADAGQPGQAAPEHVAPSRPSLAALLWLIWTLGGLGLGLLTEVLVAKGDIGRMNTVFKFGMQSWVLFGLTSAVALVWLWTRSRRWPAAGRWAWRGAMGLLVAGALVYPATATPARLADRYDTEIAPTLDGLAYMQSEQSTWEENGKRFTLAEDGAALEWMRAHIDGTPIVLEAHQEAYRWGGRVSIYTGLPTLLGWPWHETQQRSVAGVGPVLASRQALVQLLYNTTSTSDTLQLLRLYGVEYVYVGQLEQALYDPAGLAKFEAMANAREIEPVYSAGATRIYQVRPADHLPAVLTTSLPVRAPAPPPQKDLMLDRPVSELPAVNEYGWNRLADSQVVAVLLWLLAGYALLALGLPLAMLVFGGHGGVAQGAGVHGAGAHDPGAHGEVGAHGGARPTGIGGDGDDRDGENGGDGDEGEGTADVHGHDAGAHAGPRPTGDGGYAWARLVGLLLLGYAVWMPVSTRLWQYNRWGLLLGVLIVLALNAVLLILRGRRLPESRADNGRNVLFPHDTIKLAAPRWLEGEDTRRLPLRRWLTSGAADLWAELVARRRRILLVEGLYLGAFALMTGLRMLNPDLWQPFFGGEKPFEFGMLNAILRSPVMPPYSPFFSDGILNYYYYGLFLVSLPVKATGIAPAVAFNLIVPTLFAFTVVGAFALVARLTAGRASYALAGAAFVTLLGNLAAAFMGNPPPSLCTGLGVPKGVCTVLSALQGGLGGFGERLGSWFWEPSRVISPTINEFPYWSFLFADLHPHLIALPVTILAAALAYELFANRRPTTDDRRPTTDDLQAATEGSPYRVAVEGSQFSILNSQFPLSPVAGRWGLAALALGALAVTNSWDFPTYALLVGGALVGRAWRAGGPQPALAGRLLGAALKTLVLAGAALLLYLPFFQNFLALVQGVDWVREGSPLSGYLLIYGLFLAVLAPVVLGAAWRLLGPRGRWAGSRGAGQPVEDSAEPTPVVGIVAGRPMPTFSPRLALLVVVALLLFIGAAQPALALKLGLTALILVGAIILLQRRPSPATWFTIWMAVVAWMVSLGFELVFIRDHLAGGPAYRMNTVFKFGFQAWVLLALAAGAALPLLARGLRRMGLVVESAGGALLGALAAGAALPLLARVPRWMGQLAESAGWALLGALVALALVFPLAGTPSRLANRFPETTGPTLDGLAFMDRADFTAEYIGNAPINLRADGEAIRWLNEHITGTPIVLQSSMEFYRTYGVRVAANTGLPTIVSPLHESEQRDPDLVSQRDLDVQRIYSTSDIGEALRLLAKYRVDYVYVGSIERAAYGESGTAKFDQLNGSYLSLAYRNDAVQIFEVNENIYSIIGDAPPPIVVAPPPQSDTQPPVVVVPQPQPQPQPIQQDQAALERQVADNPTEAGPAFELAQRYRDQGRLDDAAAILAPAAAANPRDVALHHIWGDTLRDAGRRDEAEAAYRAAIDVDSSAGNYNKLGIELIGWGDLEQAAEVFIQASAANPDAAEPYYHLGTIYEKQNQADAAAEAYRKYLELATADAPYRQQATEALGRLGR